MNWQQSSLQRGLFKCFVVLGPLGNLLTPQLFSHAFRTYYFILLGFPLFFIPLRKKQTKAVIFALPFLLYCLFSTVLNLPNTEADLPFFRFGLLFFQFLFVAGVSGIIRNEISFVFLYLKAYFVSLIAGYILYTGFYLKVFPMEFLEKFSVLSQMGYGFLRFSPGSYPNEYGIVSSFVLSILTLLLIENKKVFSKPFLIIFYSLTLGALLLSTTRAACLAYGFSLIYLGFSKGCLKKIVMLVTAGLLSVAGILMGCGIDLSKFFYIGFSLDTLSTGSLYDRFFTWSNSLEAYLETPLIGTGFSTQTSLHNLYLQLIFELGVLGVILFLVRAFFHFFDRKYFTLQRTELSLEQKFLRTVAILGAIHVLWFAGSNHNLNHHLTWLVIFFLSSERALKSKNQLKISGVVTDAVAELTFVAKSGRE